jgi:hypothetical protein
MQFDLFTVHAATGGEQGKNWPAKQEFARGDE